MGFRTIAIENRAKLNLTLGFMEVRGETTTKVLLDDIDTLIIESQAVSLTAALLSELVKRKIKIIFCDEKHNPQSELIPYYGSVDSSRKIKTQCSWSEAVKEKIWTEIVKEKIKNQALFLKEQNYNSEALLLEKYLSEVTIGDKTNREGLAAKTYFTALFGAGFTREDDTVQNAALNYGYSLLLSTVNREIAYNGYLTQIGLCHDNIYNPFNLGSDLMEPFRILIDRMVVKNSFTKFEKEEKHEMLCIYEQEFHIASTTQIFANGIRIYVRSIFDALNDDDSGEIKFYTL